MTKKRPAPPSHAPTQAPRDIDPDTGLPARDAPIGTSLSPSPEREAAALAFAVEAARSLTDDKCEDALLLDLRGRSQITDFIVVASGTSDRQMRSAAQNVAGLADSSTLDLYRSNLNSPDEGWIFLDLVDVVVHVLSEPSRRYYDIETLWGDAPRVEWRREEESEHKPVSGADRNRAGLKPGDLPGGQR